MKFKTGHSLRTLLAVCFIFGVISGCGGGGGGDDPATTSSGAYSLRVLDSAEVGAETTTLQSGGVTLEASLASAQTITLNERFYTSGRPTGLIGGVYDIQPDGLSFLSGTRLCLSTAGSDYSINELEIVTGPNLDQRLETVADSSRARVCTTLSHSSPYSVARAVNLGSLDYTFFGNLDTKSKYEYKVLTANETDSPHGGYYEVKITVYCDLKCIESGERRFMFFQGGDSDGDLYIDEDQGAYPLWLDFAQMKWAHLKSEDGTTVGGIAYLLAAQYCKYYLGSSSLMDSYIATLDPSSNSIQRFFYKEGKTAPYQYVEITRDEIAMPGKIKIFIEVDNYPGRTYMIDRSTAAITKSWISSLDGYHELTYTVSDSGYADVNEELLYYVYVLVGVEDTPDETAGNAYDLYPRYLPVQELFAVNVMNLLRGLGWNNLEAIEIYYRDRLEVWTNNQP